MKEVEPDKQFDETPVFLPEVELIGSGNEELVEVLNKIHEATLANTALLMRLYDIQLALLSYGNKTVADSLFDTHAEGGHFNPPIFIPVIGEKEDENG